MKMQVIDDESGISRVLLEGRLDIEGARSIDAQFNLLAAGQKKIVVDLSKVSFVASMGLRTLMFGAKTLYQNGGVLAVCGPDENVEKVLHMSGFDEIAAIYPDFETAAAALMA